MFVTSIALNNLPITEAFPTDAPPDLAICHKPWLSITLTAITVLGVIIYLCKYGSRLTLCKGHRYTNTCSIYLFLSVDNYYVPIKLRNTNAIAYKIRLNTPITREHISLTKKLLWDTLLINWSDSKIVLNNKQLPMPQTVCVNLIDKYRTRHIMTNTNTTAFLMIKQGVTWYPLQVQNALTA